MKLYKTSYLTNDGHQGYVYHRSKKEVDKWKRELKNLLEPEDVDYAYSSMCTYEIFIQPDKEGILDALNRHGSHNDNG